MKVIRSLALSVALVGCGGGGDDPAPAPAVPPAPPPTGPTAPGVASAEGYWRSTTSRLLILENGDVWHLPGSGNSIGGLHRGTTQWDGATIAGQVTTTAGNAGTIGGTYVSGATIASSIVVNGNQTSINATYQAVYDKPARASDLAGLWSVLTKSLGGTISANVQVASNGGIKATTTFCTGVGSVFPRPSGKNVFDLSLSFTGASCEFNGKVLAGIAYLEPFGGSNELLLLVAAVQADRKNGFVGSGSR